MASFTERMIGAAMLNPRTYEEVEADRTATTQAMIVVVLTSLVSGLGALRQGILPVIGVILAALVAWFVFAGLIYLIGTKLLPEPQTRADIGELLRTLGFATVPQFVMILGFIPVVGCLLAIVVFVWRLATSVLAVKQALDYQSTPRAVGVVLLGFVAYLMLVWILALFGMGASMGMGMMGR